MSDPRTPGSAEAAATPDAADGLSAGGALRLDLDGRLDTDLPCVSCGYNLRGQPPHGVCPECGTGVAASLLACLERERVRPALRAARRGAGLLSVALVGCYGTACCALSEPGLALLYLVALAAMGTAGVWMLTAPDPLSTAGARLLGAARWAATGSAGCIAASLLATLAGARWPGASYLTAAGVMLLPVAAGLLTLRLRRLAWELKRPLLATATTAFAVPVLAVWALPALAAAGAMLGVLGRPTPPFPFSVAPLVPALVMVLLASPAVAGLVVGGYWAALAHHA